MHAQTPNRRMWCRRLDRFYNDEGEPWLTGPARFPLYLLGFWTVQAFWAWSVLLPVTVAQATQPRAAMGPWGWTGFALTMFFWAYEATGAPASSCLPPALNINSASCVLRVLPPWALLCMRVYWHTERSGSPANMAVTDWMF